MRFRGGSVLASILLAAWALTARPVAGAEQGPRYDPATVIDVMARVTDVREAPRTDPLSGLHLLVRTDREALDIYLAPVGFVQEFEVIFVKGDRVQIIGSRVKFGGGSVVLAREVRKGATTLYLRDRKGEPNWSSSPKPVT